MIHSVTSCIMSCYIIRDHARSCLHITYATCNSHTHMTCQCQHTYNTWYNDTALRDDMTLHPTPITRFRSFRTQPFDNLSAAVTLPIKQPLEKLVLGFWATQPSEKVLWGQILWWELGVHDISYDDAASHSAASAPRRRSSSSRIKECCYYYYYDY